MTTSTKHFILHLTCSFLSFSESRLELTYQNVKYSLTIQDTAGLTLNLFPGILLSKI